MHSLRRRAASSEPGRLFYAAWCNEDGVDPDDMDAVARANPALGIRISAEFIAAEVGGAFEVATDVGTNDPENHGQDEIHALLSRDEKASQGASHDADHRGYGESLRIQVSQ
jgi:hypothetical protein